MLTANTSIRLIPYPSIHQIMVKLQKFLLTQVILAGVSRGSSMHPTALQLLQINRRHDTVCFVHMAALNDEHLKQSNRSVAVTCLTMIICCEFAMPGDSSFAA